MKHPGRFALALISGTALAGIALAQGTPASSGAPVSFTADQVSYDKPTNIVTATGHVHAVQNGQSLFADKIVIDRNTDMATATGHVILIQPAGDTVFANEAVLTQGMKNAVMDGVSTRLAQNARMIANGARRTNDQIDELSKVVYSACNLCKDDPTAPPIWQIHARRATRDLQHQMIEYRDAVMEIYGFPVFYLPYMTEPDPSVKRQSGFLIPDIGVSSRLGVFAAIPYYYVIGPSSDITLVPVISSTKGPALRGDYRRAFNQGSLNIAFSGGRDKGAFGESVFANGTFDINQTFRAGFSYNHASNPAYLNDFSILPSIPYLTSSIYLEGFSSGAYGRVDAEEFQGLVSSVTQSKLPIVAPYGQYHFISAQDGWGGQFSLDATAFNLLRHVGSNSRRFAAVPGYELPLALAGGIVGTARVQLVTAAYNGSHLFAQPNYSTLDSSSTARVQPYGAVFLRMPFIRPTLHYGTQLLEPEFQIVASPNIGIRQNIRIPNEDSLDLEFSDANLFSLNRYPGIDRLEGGSRVDYALHAAWYLPGGATLDGLFGQSYRFHRDNNYLPGSGLTDNVSDYVGRFTIAPTPWFNVAYRTRLDHKSVRARMIDATANFGTPALNISGGYLYTSTNPYVLYDTASTTVLNLNPPAGYFVPRHEITLNAGASFGQWSVTAGVQRNLQSGQFDNASFNAGWQNDCFGISLNFSKRFTSYNLDKGNTIVLIQFSFKTLGDIGFSAL